MKEWKHCVLDAVVLYKCLILYIFYASSHQTRLKATLSKGLQKENDETLKITQESWRLEWIFILKQSRLSNGGKHPLSKKFQRDAVRGIKLLEWLFVLHISTNQECMGEKKQKVWFHAQTP